MSAHTAMEWILSFVMTWVLGLGLALILRFLVFKRPLKKWPAIIIAILWLLLNLSFWIVMESENVSHLVQYVMVIISYRIMVREDKPAEPTLSQTDRVDIQRKKQAASDWDE